MCSSVVVCNRGGHYCFTMSYVRKQIARQDSPAQLYAATGSDRNYAVYQLRCIPFAHQNEASDPFQLKPLPFHVRRVQPSSHINPVPSKVKYRLCPGCCHSTYQVPQCASRYNWSEFRSKIFVFTQNVDTRQTPHFLHVLYAVHTN